MKMNQKDILYTSLLGSNVTKSISKFTAIENQLMKHVTPPISFLPVNNTSEIKTVSNDFNANVWKADAPTPKARQFFPFTFVSDDGQRYLLPYEPIISINGKNTIVRRNVAKANKMIGSIKERWNQADYEITITGVLIGSLLTGSVEDCYPKKDFERLRDFMTASKALTVYCEPLQLLGIGKIVIEDFSFPFTKGENVQAYEIKAYSDFTYNLLLDIKD